MKSASSNTKNADQNYQSPATKKRNKWTPEQREAHNKKVREKLAAKRAERIAKGLKGQTNPKRINIEQYHKMQALWKKINHPHEEQIKKWQKQQQLSNLHSNLFTRIY